MTLAGTNTYVLFARTDAIVVDPGPLLPEHLDRVAQLVERRGLRVRALVTTHSHPDHAEALWALGDQLGAPCFPSARGAGEVLAEVRVEVVALPGHASDHVGFVLADRRVLTGDHVLGEGTTAIIYPDGSLEEYLASLALLEELGPSALLPGHGPVVGPDRALDVLRLLRAHRLSRLDELRGLLEGGAGLDAIVGSVYGEIGDPVRREAAVRSTLAGLVWIAANDEGAIALRARELLAKEGDAHRDLPSASR